MTEEKNSNATGNTSCDDDNLLDVPCLNGDSKLVPQVTPNGVIWTKDSDTKKEEQKNVFAATTTTNNKATFGTFGAPSTTFGGNNPFGNTTKTNTGNLSHQFPSFGNPSTQKGIFENQSTANFGFSSTSFGANNVFGHLPATGLYGNLPTPSGIFGNPPTHNPFAGLCQNQNQFSFCNERIPPFTYDGFTLKTLNKPNIKYHEHTDLLKEIRELKREIKILSREKEEHLEQIQYLKKFELRNRTLVQQNDKLEEENDNLKDEILILKSK
jgi:hypothetical protein